MDTLNGIVDSKKGGLFSVGAVLGVHGLMSILSLIFGGWWLLGYYFLSLWAVPFLEIGLAVVMLLLYATIHAQSSKILKVALFVLAIVSLGLQMLYNISLIVVLALGAKPTIEKLKEHGHSTGPYIAWLVITSIMALILTLAMLLNIKFANDTRTK